MESKTLKKALLCYLRFKRGMIYVATECGMFNADVLAIKDDKLIEVEIKISKSDFLADFKKPKHESYREADIGTPHLFYFCVPSDMSDYVLNYINSHNLPYGVMSVVSKVSSWKDAVSIVKSAKKIHNREIGKNTKDIIAARMSSEIANLYLKMR